VIERSIRFNIHSQHTLTELLEQKKSLSNLYTYNPGEKIAESEIASAIEEAIHAEPSPYDSHPAPHTRFELVHALDTGHTDRTGSTVAELWDLFQDKETLQLSGVAENVSGGEKTKVFFRLAI